MIAGLPIRWKLALWSALATGAALAVFAWVTLVILYRNEVVEEDGELLAIAQHLQQSFEQAKGAGHPFVESDLDAWVSYAFFDERGAFLQGNKLMDPELARSVLGSREPVLREFRGKHWRLHVLPGRGNTLVAAYDMQEMDETEENLVTAYLLSLPLVMVVVAAGAFWLSARALRPIREITDTAAAMQADSLDRRLSLPKAEDEIRRLSVVLNGLFERLERSFQQSRRFASDASHEMRTPLTIMRGEVERLLQQPELPQALETGLLNLQEEIAYLDRLTERLLMLARFDAGQALQLSAQVDFSRLLSDACEDLELVATARKVVFESRVTPEIWVKGDADLLRRLILNLVDNATRYNKPGGHLRCSLSREGASAVFRIANEGESIPEALRGSVFQRFFKADSSRSEHKGHGLGLSLCREIARAHGGELVLSSEAEPGWTEFVVTLPLAQS